MPSRGRQTRSREWLAFLVRLTLLPLAMRHLLQRDRVTILLYHRPSAATFGVHLAALKRRYNLISLRALTDALEQGDLRTLPPRSLVITFDDGHASNYELSGLFRAAGAPPTIFLCSGIVDTPQPFWFDTVEDSGPLKQMPDDERLAVLARNGQNGAATPRAALSRQEIEELKPVADLQAHTVSHPILPRCPDEKARREIHDSRVQLEERFGLNIDAFAYPNGGYSPRDCEFVREAGYRCALTIDFGFNTLDTDPMRLRRIVINDDLDGPNVVLLKACGLWGAARRLLSRRAR